MILVTLGTQDKQFTRLLTSVENAIQKGLINEPVIVQAGHTKYQSSLMQIFDFVTPTEMDKYIKESSYIIMHGGVGSIFNALNYNKKIIAVARLKEYGEHENNHQLQIINEFSKLGFLIDGTKDLNKAIKKIPEFKPNKYQSNNANFVEMITSYIDNN